MRHPSAALWVTALLVCVACGSDSAVATRTIVTLDADSTLAAVAARLYVRISSEGTELLAREIDHDLWPQRLLVEPLEGDASRSFELLAEAYDDDEQLVASHTLRTGFVAGKTRYARVVLTKCARPTEGALAPSALVDSESLASAATARCEAAVAGSGGGGAGGKQAPGASTKDGGSGAAGVGGSVAGRNSGGGGAPAPATEVCGDGHLSGEELCDTAIASGQFSCPKQCSSKDPCNPGTLVGTGCQAHCELKLIRERKRDDGCCPDGADANTDNDCPARCGNGVVEAGELCDPPETCTLEMLCGTPPACVQVGIKGDPSKCSADCEQKPLATCKTGDGCCPSACTHDQDQDCPVACGDGHVDVGAGETCEPNSADKPCPTSCDDKDACTDDLLTGSPTACNVTCTHSRIHLSRNGDGCCPSEAGANANTDNDCRPLCGNGVLEAGELCDGRCPSSAADCDDGNLCTEDAFTGSGCQRHCTNNQRAASQTADGCCPTGANGGTDPDCHNLLEGRVFESSLPASTSEPNHPVALITDGNDGTRWISTPASPVTLTVDLGASYTLTRIEIRWAGDTIRHFSLAVSPDRSAWTTIVSGTTSNVQVEPRTYLPPFSAAATGRYFRITGTDRWVASYGNSIFEVRLYDN